DLSSETALVQLGDALRQSATIDWQAAPADGQGNARAVLNPADHRDRVGTVIEVTPEAARIAASKALANAAGGAAVPPAERAACLDRAADLMQSRMQLLIGLIMREAGKSAPNAIAEVREAIDFLRYYAQQARATLAAAH